MATICNLLWLGDQLGILPCDLIATLYFTTPAPGQSWQESFVSPRYRRAATMTIPIASGCLALDLYILVLPMVPIWKLQLSPKKNIGVCAVLQLE
jgi:hypothetical protein